MVKKEAIDCINQAKKHNIEYSIAFDFEYDSVRYAQENGVTVTKKLAVELMKAFCNEIKRVGYRVAVYTNRDFLENYYTVEEIGKQDYEIWYVHYSEEMKRKQVSLWQYSSGGHIEGINGRVDLDYSLEDIDQHMGGKNKMGNGFNELLTVESPVHGTELYVFSIEGHMMCTNERGALIIDRKGIKKGCSLMVCILYKVHILVVLGHPL